MTWILGIAGALLAVIIIISIIFLRREWNRTTFFDHTSINGFDVSGKSPDEVLPVFTDEYTIKSTIKKYSDFVQYPIMVECEHQHRDPVF